jgi:Ring finger domain
MIYRTSSLLLLLVLACNLASYQAWSAIRQLNSTSLEAPNSTGSPNVNYIYNGTITQTLSSHVRQYPMQTVYLSSDLEHTVSNFRLMFPPRNYSSLCKNLSSSTHYGYLDNMTAPLSNEKSDYETVGIILNGVNDSQALCNIEDKINNIRFLNHILEPQMLYVKHIILDEGQRMDDSLEYATSLVDLSINFSFIYLSQDAIENIETTMISYKDDNHKNNIDASPYLLDETSNKWDIKVVLHVDLLLSFTKTTVDGKATKNMTNETSGVLISTIVIVFVIVWITVCIVHKNDRQQQHSHVETEILGREIERQIQLLKKKNKHRLTEAEFDELPIIKYKQGLYQKLKQQEKDIGSVIDHHIDKSNNTVDNLGDISKSFNPTAIANQFKNTTQLDAVATCRDLSIHSAPSFRRSNSRDVDFTSTNNSNINTVSSRNLMHRMMSLDVILFQSRVDIPFSNDVDVKDCGDEVAAGTQTSDLEAQSEDSNNNNIDWDTESNDCTNICYNDDVCPICIEDFIIDENIVSLPSCKHIFHKDCIQQWLLKKQGCCPMCKVNVLDDQQTTQHEQGIIEIATERAIEICQRNLRLSQQLQSM